MRKTDELRLSELLDEKGELFGHTLAAEWVPPEKVVLVGGALTIRSFVNISLQQRIKPPRRLLDQFISLADPSAEEARGTGRSDARICSFATSYGGLRIFDQPGDEAQWPRERIEDCDVWRYFARAMGALQRIAADQYRGESGSKEDWQAIHEMPVVMEPKEHDSPLYASLDEKWVRAALCVNKKLQQNPRVFGFLINTLLEMGEVRPTLTWPDQAGKAMRPVTTYSSRSLLSQLALQLWLRVARIDAFVVCTHCQKPYSPVVRAPKAGLRHFCPDCRQQGVPKRYALMDFRKRQHQSRVRS